MKSRTKEMTILNNWYFGDSCGDCRLQYCEGGLITNISILIVNYVLPSLMIVAYKDNQINSYSRRQLEMSFFRVMVSFTICKIASRELIESYLSLLMM